MFLPRVAPRISCTTPQINADIGCVKPPNTQALASSALIINDGSLGGLLACWAEGVVRANLVQGATSDAAASGLIAWFPGDTASPSAPGSIARRRRAVECQVDTCGLGGWSDRQLIRTEGITHALSGISEAALSGTRQSVMLLNACLEALSRSIPRVIWPVHAGGGGGGGAEGSSTGGDLEALAAISDRALLISQLMLVDSGHTSRRHALRIETPYMDFTDAQMVDLALDMDAPLGACCLCINDPEDTPAQHGNARGNNGCGQCSGCMRWREALIAVDPARALTIEVFHGQTTTSVR